MRSVCFRFLLLLFVAPALYAQVNPHTQIRWPINCNNPHMTYNWANNKCEATNQTLNEYPFQNNMDGNVIGCLQADGSIARCPVNSLTWTGVQVSGGQGSGQTTVTLTSSGQALCNFDGIGFPVIGDYVQISGTTPGYCHDAGATVPVNGYPIFGQVLANNPPLRQATIAINSGSGGLPGPAGPPGGSLSYPGCTTDSSNGMKCTGSLTAGSVANVYVGPQPMPSNVVTIGPSSPPTASWQFDTKSPSAAYASLVPGSTITGSGSSQNVSYPGTLSAANAVASVNTEIYIMAPPYNAKCDWNGITGTDDTAAFNAAWAAIQGGTGGSILLPAKSCYVPNGLNLSTSANVSGATWRIHGQGKVVSQIVTNNANSISRRRLKVHLSS